jgi:hypothetical protein
MLDYSEFGFCGPTYQSQSPNVNAERAINLYLEVLGDGKTRPSMLYTPGLKLHANLGSSAVLGQFPCRPNGSTVDRLFAVVQSGNNQVLFEVFQDGTFKDRGFLNAPTTPIVTMAHNGTQLLICTGGQLWVLNLSTNALAPATSPPSDPILMVEYCDGFGIGLKANANKFWVSDLLDFDTWDPLSVAEVSEFPDNVVSMIVNQRQIAFLGIKQSVVYANAGAVQVPFLPIQGAFIEAGCAAPFARNRLDNSVFWLDLDERGQAVARRANGYTPQRISTHSVETFWNTYPTISDAVSYTYTEAGHPFWVLYFPSGSSADGIPGQGATWVYDVATGMWHERAFWNAQKGHFQAHHSQNHAFAWGKHFVGDRQSGNLYQMGNQFLDDNGENIVRVRRAQNISKNNQFMRYPELIIDVETGLGPQPPLPGPSDAPSQYVLAASDGTLFAVSISDTPNIQLVQVSDGAPDAIFLNDRSLPNTTWMLGVVNSGGGVGNLELVEARHQSGPLNALPFSTTGKSLQTYLYVDNGRLAYPDPVPSVRDPELYLRWSKDHAHTWSNYYTHKCGQAGQFTKRVIQRRMGRARTITFEVRMSDPIPWRFVDAYIRVGA